MRNIALAAVLLAAVIYPLLAPNYLVTVGMLMFFTAFIGQSWNISGGFAGQTSFGHAVFFGVGAYTSTILHVSHGWNPWLAWPVAMAMGGAVGQAWTDSSACSSVRRRRVPRASCDLEKLGVRCISAPISSWV